jgi:hypothetical protein
MPVAEFIVNLPGTTSNPQEYELHRTFIKDIQERTATA